MNDQINMMEVTVNGKKELRQIDYIDARMGRQFPVLKEGEQIIRIITGEVIIISSGMTCLDAKTAMDMLDNPAEPNQELQDLLKLK